MIVLDTHAWIWWETDPHRLPASARASLARSVDVGVPAICSFEIALLVDRGRLQLDRSPLSWLREALARERVVLLPLTPEIAVRSSTLPDSIRDPADRLIAATALEHACPLVTKDERLSAIPGLRVVW